MFFQNRRFEKQFKDFSPKRAFYKLINTESGLIITSKIHFMTENKFLNIFFSFFAQIRQETKMPISFAFAVKSSQHSFALMSAVLVIGQFVMDYNFLRQISIQIS